MNRQEAEELAETGDLGWEHFEGLFDRLDRSEAVVESAKAFRKAYQTPNSDWPRAMHRFAASLDAYDAAARRAKE